MRAVVGFPWPGLVLVAGMLVVAGCGGGFSAAAPPTGTATPAPVPSPAAGSGGPQPPSEEPEKPPGVAGGRVTDALALARAHSQTLADSSYAVTVNETTWAATGSRRSHVASTIRVSRAGHQEVRSIEAAGPEGRLPVFPNATRVDMYAENATGYVRGINTTTTGSARAAADATVQYARRDWRAEQFHRLQPPHRPGYVLGHLLMAMEVRVTPVSRGGATLYRLTSVDLRMPASLARVLDVRDHARVENATLDALVDADGVVHEYHLTYRVGHNGTVTYGRRAVRYSGVGTAVVRRPPWYDAARTATRSGTGPGGSESGSPPPTESPTGA